MPDTTQHCFRDAVHTDAPDMFRLMSAEEVVHMLAYPSVNALRMACKTGRLLLTPRRIPGRKGTFFVSTEVQAVLRSWAHPPAKGDAM